MITLSFNIVFEPANRGLYVSTYVEIGLVLSVRNAYVQMHGENVMWSHSCSKRKAFPLAPCETVTMRVTINRLAFGSRARRKRSPACRSLGERA